MPGPHCLWRRGRMALHFYVGLFRDSVWIGLAELEIQITGTGRHVFLCAA